MLAVVMVTTSSDLGAEMAGVFFFPFFVLPCMFESAATFTPARSLADA